MRPAENILELAKINLAASVRALLEDVFSMQPENSYSYLKLAKIHHLKPMLFKRLLNFAAFAEIISWKGQDIFTFSNQERREFDIYALELLKVLGYEEEIVVEKTSSGAINLGLKKEILEDSDGKLKVKSSLQGLVSSDSPISMRNWIRNYADVSSRLFSKECLHQTIISGRTQWSHAFGLEVESPFDLEKFNISLFETLMKAMHQSNVAESELLCPKLDLHSAGSLLDIGGASGAVADGICRQYPNISNYVIYELETAIPTYQRIRKSQIQQESTPINYRAGNFFSQPDAPTLVGLETTEVFDSILLGWIIHDWNDSDAVIILRKAKSHLKNYGKLFLLEAVLPDDRQGPVTMLDLTMMVQTGGKERTTSEYECLLSQAGLRLSRVVPTGGRRQILEVEHA